MRKITSLILALVVLAGLLPQVEAFAAETGPLPGSFTVGSVAPSVTGLEIYSDSGCTLIASSLTPQVMYYAKVTVADANTLNDVTQIKLKILYDVNGTNPDETTITAGDAQTAAIITWTKESGLYAIGAGVGTTWAVVTGSSVLPAMSASSGDWVIAFKVGKVATESLGSAKWDFHARATNTVGYTAGAYKRNKTIPWYGQVSMNTANVNFGSVPPGTGFGAGINKVTGISSTWVSNGDWMEKVKSSATWIGTTNTASLDATGNTANPQEFSLKAWTSDDYASALLLDTTGITVEAEGVQTSESGIPHLTGTLWLKLASVFAIDQYSGTISAVISNR